MNATIVRVIGIVLVVILVFLVERCLRPIWSKAIAVVLSACLATVLYCYTAAMSIPANEDQLVRVSGRVTAAEVEYGHLVFTIEGLAVKFRYLDWMPYFDFVNAHVKAGALVELWYVAGSTEPIAVWKILLEPNHAVELAEIARAHSHQRFLAIGMAVFASAYGAWQAISIWRLVRSARRS